MVDIFEVVPGGLLVIIGIIIFCMILIFGIAKLERRLKKQQPAKNNNSGASRGALSEEEMDGGFVVGQVYQMEDGTLAKYAGSGQFNKIKQK
ncbi:MAG TPA: hypothetical protein VJ857_03980 [Methanocorpusculum sp.]|jgi:hypothetical protein|nr:hypothetical protein [Methanocorpusculum sp.]HJJ53767.1 hypothetical protein [Methanocorpusculum sp.]HKL97807.1 hypothetical protein [Methanocorpusculum sp.]